MLTVASIPAAHPYVRSVVDPAQLRLLDDPVPPGATEPGQWWPPQLLDPGHLRRYLDGPAPGPDVLHVHFGFDTDGPDRLSEVVDLLGARRIPLVMTVHDLQNPHFVAQEAHVERLDVLVPAAAAVITLTDGAAAEIARRWGREATVLPHPHVLPIAAVGAARQARRRPVIGIHAKNLRANVDPWPLLDRLVERRADDWQVRLDLDEEALGAPRAGEAGRVRLDGYRRAGVDVRTHRRFSDQEMIDYLADVDVLVLPYRHGTHSGWIEACHDAGVQAVVPDCGHFHRQHPNPVFGYGIGRFDAEGFDEAVRQAVLGARAAPTIVDEARRVHRAEQRRRVREATVRLYHQVVAGARDEVLRPGVA